VPFLKALESLFQGMDNSNCPWTDPDLSTEAYLRMGKVTVVTFSYTFIHALMFMLAKGWATTNN